MEPQHPSPSAYGADPHQDGGDPHDSAETDASPEPGTISAEPDATSAESGTPSADPAAGGVDIPDPWAPKPPLPTVPMPTVVPPGAWPIPRLAAPQAAVPMPSVEPPPRAQTPPEGAAYEIPRLPPQETGQPGGGPDQPQWSPAQPPAPEAAQPQRHGDAAQDRSARHARQHDGQQVFTAAQTGAFAVPQDAVGTPMPSRVEGRNAGPSIMPLDLTQAALVRTRKEEPSGGWRRVLYKASFGGINPGISKEQAERNALTDRVRTPIQGCHKIAVVSLKGGIGKTTTTSCLGLTLAHYRGDRVVALDANPDAGTLAERLTGVTDVSVRTMLDNIEDIRSFTDISRYMSLAGRLQVLASDQDAEISEAFDADQYTKVTDLLGRYYNVVLTDSGTGMLHSAMQGTLEQANSLVVVGAPSVDGASRAAKTLDWLIAHGYGDLVARSVAVISSVRAKSDSVDMNVLRNHFSARCRAVIEIPYDPHLVVGGRIDMTQLKPETEVAYLELAAAVADGFHPGTR